MALTREIEAIIKEFDYNLWNVAEALQDCRDDAEKGIAELEKEIADHKCE